jgi:hypothetical protein
MIERHTTGDFRIYGYLHGIREEYHKLFDRVLTGPDDPSHAEKLDQLARAALEDSASDDDWLVFIDGDAFPVNALDDPIADYLKNTKLVAVQRVENNGDLQPHPCFAVMTAETWKAFPFTWKEGYAWTDIAGVAQTDVGAGILEVIDQYELPWTKLHRTNQYDLHPLMFGIYADLVYHHAAGFRDEILIRRDVHDLMKPQMRRLDGRILLRLTPKKLRSRVRKSMLHPEGRKRKKVFKRNAIMSRRMLEKMITNVDHVIGVLRGEENPEHLL